ncbi:hypothetical protein SLS62_008466 [Diatrype stigma]|uniref:SGNH hydrolase-type esterase domain-containing protein n=1 Tax=Diatrype stigma TaxID=117547 RepID=A0AAN9ULA4_9PEZI
MPLHIAQIGSSFAAGPGIPPVADSRAMRSGANFASLVRQRLEAEGDSGARLTDLSVSGATLLQLVSERQDGRFAPQIDLLPADADVVLALGGGNDIGYIGGLFEDTLAAAPWPARLLARLLFGAGAPRKNAPLAVDALAARYGAILDAAHARAPGARVLVVEYVTMLGPDVRPAGSGSGEEADVAFGADRVAHHRAVAAQLLQATAMAADAPERRAWCARVEVDGPSRAHGVGSAEPWVNGFSWGLFWAGGAFHPNAEGMKAVSELVYRKLVEMGLVVGKKPGE